MCVCVCVRMRVNANLRWQKLKTFKVLCKMLSIGESLGDFSRICYAYKIE